MRKHNFHQPNEPLIDATTPTTVTNDGFHLRTALVIPTDGASIDILDHEQKPIARLFITHHGAGAWANIDIHPRQPQQFLRLIALDDGAPIVRTRLPRGLSVAIDLSPDATRAGDEQVLP